MLDVIREVVGELVRLGQRDRRWRDGYRLLAAVVTLVAVWAVVGWVRQPTVGLQGRVTLGGRPIGQGLISFHVARGSDIGHLAAGAMIRDGRYEVAATHGLPPGMYIVRIRSPQSPPVGPSGVAPPAEDRVPFEYNDGSAVIIEVSRFGRTRFDFEIP